MNMKQKQAIFTFSILILVSLACALPAGIGNRVRDLVENQTSEVVEQAEEIIDQNPDAMEQVQEIIPEVTPPEGAQEAVEQLITTITGNDTSMLDSFRTSFTLTTERISSTGSVITQRVEMQEEINRTQSLYHNKIHSEGTGDEAVEGNLDIYILSDKTYVYDASTTEFPCIMVSGGMENIGEYAFLRPEDFFDEIDTAELIERGVTVNGVLSDHYRVQHTGVEMAETAVEEGEIWIAQDGGFIVRYTGSAEGKFDADGETEEGKINWEYNLFDVDQVNIIDFPVECRDQQEAVEDIPVPDNAVNKESIAGLVTFESPDTPEQVGEYYREQLPTGGWRITEDSEMASLVMMTAEKEGKNLQIMITPGETTGSSVIISTIPLQ